jgi:hypothetical protein
VCIDYNDAMGIVDLSDQHILMYSMTQKRMKKYYHKIFHHLLDQMVFNMFVIFIKHSGNYNHLQFCMRIVQKLFEKYGGATPSEVLPVRAIKTLHPGPSGRFTGRHFLNVNPPTGTRKHASKRCVWTKKNGKTQNAGAMNVMIHCVQHLVSLLRSQEYTQLVKKLPAFYGTRRLITVFKRARHLSLS